MPKNLLKLCCYDFRVIKEVVYFFYHPKNENRNASFIGIKFKYKNYSAKRSIWIFQIQFIFDASFST